MPDTIAILDAAVADIKNTDTGEVEYATAESSMGLVIATLRNLLAERGIPYAADTDALQELTGSEAQLAYLQGKGIVVYGDTEAGDEAWQSTDLGWWNLYYVLSSAMLTDFNMSTPPTNGQAPIWNAGQSKWVPGDPTVANLGWANITGKPTMPAGAIVGTTDSQTLTNKTISGASNTLSAIPQSAIVTLVADLAAIVASVALKAPLASPALTGSATGVNLALSGTLSVTGITGLADTNMSIPTYPDNAAAVAALLPGGRLYQTATGEVRIVV